MNETQEKLGAHEVATWLRRHPRFLQQFPDLALSLVVPREEGSASSLASYQLEVLREKNRELSRRLQELFGTAQENERLSVRMHQLTLGLMRQTSAADVQLAGRALRHQRQIGVEDVGHASANHTADRHAAEAFFQLLGRQTGQGHDHSFGRAVGVEKQARLECRANPRQVLASQGFAAGDAHAHR